MSARITYKDLGWAKILEQVTALGKANVRVGWVGPDAEKPHGDSGLTVAEVAIVNEFGTSDGHVPARAPLRTTMHELERGAAANKLAEVAKYAINGQDGVRALDHAGKWAVDRLRAVITSGQITPPNAPSTILQKGSDIPLIDTGLLVESANFEISLTREESEFESFEVEGVMSGIIGGSGE